MEWIPLTEVTYVCAELSCPNKLWWTLTQEFAIDELQASDSADIWGDGEPEDPKWRSG